MSFDSPDNKDASHEKEKNEINKNNLNINNDTFKPNECKKTGNIIDDNAIQFMLNHIIKESFQIDDKKKGFFPVEVDFKIEDYDNGNLKYEKSFEIKDGKINSSSKIINDKDINNDLSNKNQKNETILNKNLKKKKNYKKINKIDIASSIGDEKCLSSWLKKNLDANNKFIGDTSEYSSEAIDNASANGKINILNWWLNASKNNNIELKYTEKAINYASKHENIESLDWWINSNLALKYDSNAIDYASCGCKFKSLNWWIEAQNKNNLRFEYTNKSIDCAKHDKHKLFKLIKWWISTIEKEPDLKIKYSNEFLNYLNIWGYTDLLDLLQKQGKNDYNKNTFIFDISNANKTQKENNKTSAQDNKTSIQDNKTPMPDNKPKIQDNKPKIQDHKPHIFDFFNVVGAMPININKSRDQFKPNYDLKNLPEEIVKHIKDKEEELNNNMLTNGKAKEYIDNLIKIPFGKYKIEKIFTFIEDLIKKLNSINLSSNNEYIRTYKIENETNIINFFEKKKYFSESQYIKLSKLFNNFLEIRKKYINYVNDILDKAVYGQEITKKNIKCIISQWLTGGFKTGVVIGIQGPPGVGKTTIIKNALSKCLIDFIDYNLDCDEPYIKEILDEKSERPFCFLSLGGSSNGSTLVGHNITYHGATSGDIVKHLKEAKVMNPILYFDELDKISNTEYGHEISSVLTHITDPVQNSHFTDRYFSEVKIDLSKCIIVFSYNDSKKIDRILLDRIQEIRLNPIKYNEKLIICKKFIIPEICSHLGYNLLDINISDDALELIINEYTLEAGVRKLKEKLYEVFRMNHLNLIEKCENKIIKKDISMKFINDVLSEHPKNTLKKIKSSNMVGCINGLYASSLGIGGITPIQVKQVFSKENLHIGITGSIEKIMEESIKVAKTVAWNLLTKKEQDDIIKEWDSRGIHIHFPDGSTSKDGPSGGVAITCAIYSLFINKSIKNNIAITGEIDLNGNITEIGGLDAKLNGAKKAGINLVLIPVENQREFDIVKKNNPDLIDKNFKVNTIRHIIETLKFIF